MTGGAELQLTSDAAPRKRGRPKGSTNRRARDLKGLIDAKYGSSAAQQLAQLALVTPAELKAAGGSMAKAIVAKAADLVEHVRRAQATRDEHLRETIRLEFERLLLDVRDVTAKELRAALDQCLKRIREAGGGMTLAQALGMMADARRDLLPYTDQKQPLAIDATVNQDRPSVILMGAAPVADLATMAVENTEVFEGVYTEVSPSKSHGEQQAIEFAGEPPPADAD